MKMAIQYPPKPNIGRLLYIEWYGINKPDIQAVLYNNKSLTATLTKVEGGSIIPGGDIGNNRNLKITTQKHNSLWKIDLQPTGDNQMPAPGCKNIPIKTKKTANACQTKLIKEVELATLPSY